MQPNFVFIICRPGGVGSGDGVPGERGSLGWRAWVQGQEWGSRGVERGSVGWRGHGSRGGESLASKRAPEGPERDAPR